MSFQRTLQVSPIFRCPDSTEMKFSRYVLRVNFLYICVPLTYWQAQ